MEKLSFELSLSRNNFNTAIPIEIHRTYHYLKKSRAYLCIQTGRLCTNIVIGCSSQRRVSSISMVGIGVA